MKNTFTSKKQFHQISDMVAHTFGMKTARTKHKIATSSGYKNTNALLASIPCETKTSSNPTKSAFNTNSIERLLSENQIKEDLFNIHYRQKCFLSSVSDFRFVHFELPLYLCLIVDGFYFTSQEWLSKTVWEASTHDKNTISLSSEYEGNFNMKLSTFQHIIGNYIYNEEELLKFKDVQLEELIYASNIDQYNIIANSKKLHKIMDNAEKTQLAARYLRAMIEIQNKYNRFYNDDDCIYTDYCDHMFPSFIFNLKRKVSCNDYRTLEEQISDLSILSTPLKGSLYNENIENIAYENDIFSHVIEFCLGHNKLADSDFLKIIKMSFKKDENELNDFDFGVRRHFNYCWTETAKTFFKNDHDENEFLISDLLLSFEEAMISKVDVSLLKEFLSSTPIDGKYFNPFSDEDLNLTEENAFHGKSLLSWLVMNEAATVEYITDSVMHLNRIRESKLIQLLMTNFKKELEETNFSANFFSLHLMPIRANLHLIHKNKRKEFSLKWIENNYLTILDEILKAKTLMEALKMESKTRKEIL